ncbi:MAG: DUF2490 domain-containing protein [Cytophagales bacterium]
MKNYKALIGTLLLLANISWGQNRESVYNNVGWFVYLGDHKIKGKWGLHTEYQWRRTNFITNWQQSLARIGINYDVNPQLMLTIGYGQIETFSYGELPISRLDNAGNAQSFPEHRIYQDAVFKNNLGNIEIGHRFRIEERWIGNFYNSNGEQIPDKWRYLTRFRYRIRLAYPLQGSTIDPSEFYLHGYDELFIGAGINVGGNVFDQNRINVGLGFKASGSMKIEVGYFNQIVQKPRVHPFTKLPVFEYNHGFLIALLYNINFEEAFKRKSEESQ